MRYLLCVLVASLFLTSCGSKDPHNIQFFTHEGCPYCEKALKYIQINYPKLPIQVLEIGSEENMVKFAQCAQRFRLDRNNLGTPLICFDNHYIMGWSPENQKLFNEYIKPYLKK